MDLATTTGFECLLFNIAVELFQCFMRSLTEIVEFAPLIDTIVIINSKQVISMIQYV